MFFPTITELLENLIQTGRGLERSCGVFRLIQKYLCGHLQKRGQQGQNVQRISQCVMSSLKQRFCFYVLLGVSRENLTIHKAIN
jgi:hypothetical protein